MYTLIGKLKWYWQVLLTIVFIAAIITGYLFARSYGYDKAFKEFQAKDAVKKQKSDELIAHAEMLEKRVAELEPKLAAWEKLDDEKAKLNGVISDKINNAVAEGQKRDETTNAPADCWTRAERTCANFRQLKPPIEIDCDAYKKRLCTVTTGSGCQ